MLFGLTIILNYAYLKNNEYTLYANEMPIRKDAISFHNRKLKWARLPVFCL